MKENPIPIELLIFDLDGTLTDSIPPAIKSIQKMLIRLGYPPKTTEEINEYVGFGEIPLIAGSIGTNDPEKVKEAMHTYEAIYKEEDIMDVMLFPDVERFLERNKNRKMAILSNKKDEFIHIILKNRKIGGYFQKIFGGDSAPCLKPDPQAIYKILDEFGIKKERAMMVGDMTIDILTGKNAGIFTCSITHGFDEREKLERLKPDFLIDGIMELEKMIV